MRLTKELTAQQLWTIASDAAHRDADLLDEIVDHPATYRALSDWAVTTLAEEDVRLAPPPPAPEDESEPGRRGLRLPGVSLSRRRRSESPDASQQNQSPDKKPAPQDSTSPAAQASKQEQQDPRPSTVGNLSSEKEHLQSPSTVDDPARAPTDTSVTPSESTDPSLPSSDAEQFSSSNLIESSSPSAGDGEGGLGAWLAAAPVSTKVEPAVSTTASEIVSVSAQQTEQKFISSQRKNWIHRPAPMGFVLVLAVIEVLTLLALGVVATRSSEAEPVQTPTIIITPEVTPTITMTPTATPSL